MTTSKLPRPVAVIVLAAGRGTRLPGSLPKALVECLGEPLLAHVRRAIAPLHPRESVVVVGHAREALGVWLEAHWPGAHAAVQEPQHGTGHAARVALEAIPDFRGDVVVVCADVPQVTTDDLTALLAAHRRSAAAGTVLVGEASRPPDASGASSGAPTAGRAGHRGGARRDAGATRARRVQHGDLRLRRRAAAARARRPAARERPGRAVLDRRRGRAGDLRATASRRSRPTERLVPARGEHAGRPRVRRHGTSGSASSDAHLAAGVQIVDPDSTQIEPDVEIAPGARILPWTYVAHGCSHRRRLRRRTVRPPARRNRARPRGAGGELRRGEGHADGRGREGEAPHLPRRRRRGRGREHRMRDHHGELRREAQASHDRGRRGPHRLRNRARGARDRRRGRPDRARVPS